MYGGSWLKRTLALLETMVPLWRWPCVVLVMSHRCFVKVMKSVRQEAGMWTTSSFEETTGISTTLCHWHFLRGKGPKNFYYPETFHENLSKSTLQANPLSLALLTFVNFLRCPLPRHESGAVALEIAPLFNCCISQGRKHGETERSERLFCPPEETSHSHPPIRRQRCLGNVNNFLL